LSSFILHVQRISKRFGSIRVFDELSFTHEGGILGIAGSNGSGKSTLLQCLASLKRPSSGTITWEMDGQTIKKATLRAHLGFAAPYVNMYKELTCRENLNFLLKLRGIEDRLALINEILQKMGLGSLANQPFNKLSTGQQQRLRLSGALIHQPDILLLDEPGSNLDASGKILIKDIIGIFKDKQKTVFIASNNSNELGYCDRVFSVEKEQFV
jgi:ABC-type multidrug transport system ATPase subunit